MSVQVIQSALHLLKSRVFDFNWWGDSVIATIPVKTQAVGQIPLTGNEALVFEWKVVGFDRQRPAIGYVCGAGKGFFTLHGRPDYLPVIDAVSQSVVDPAGALMSVVPSISPEGDLVIKGSGGSLVAGAVGRFEIVGVELISFVG